MYLYMCVCVHARACEHVHARAYGTVGQPAWLPPRPVASLSLTVPTNLHLAPSCPSPSAGPGHSVLCALHLHFPPMSCELKNEYREKNMNT